MQREKSVMNNQHVVQHWAAGRHDAALKELDTVTTMDDAITSRLALLSARVPQS